MNPEAAASIDADRLNALVNKLIGELSAVASAPLVTLGDRLGLYKAMQGAGPMTSAELATATGIR